MGREGEHANEEKGNVEAGGKNGNEERWWRRGNPQRSWTEKCRARERKRGERRLEKRMAGTWEQIMLPRDVTQHDGWTRSSSHHVRARASKNTRRESTADRLYQWHS